MNEFTNALADVSVGNYIPLMVISLILLIGGADKLLDATEDLAKKLGTSEFIIGLTIVALGTSLPEIFVGLQSVSKETENLAMGAIVGSNISNIALIFGVACIGREIYPRKNITSKRQYIPLIASAILLGFFLYSDNAINLFEAFCILLVLPVFLYVIYSEKNIGVDIQDDSNKSKQSNVLWSLIILIVSFIALYFGSEGVVLAGKGMGEVFGISQIVIGLIVVAVGTSLPELAVTIGAIMKKRTDVVVGNENLSEHNYYYYRGTDAIDFRSKNIESIENIYVQRFNKDFVDLRIKFLGKLDKIINQLKREKIDLQLINDQWVIKTL